MLLSIFLLLLVLLPYIIYYLQKHTETRTNLACGTLLEDTRDYNSLTPKRGADITVCPQWPLSVEGILYNGDYTVT